MSVGCVVAIVKAAGLLALCFVICISLASSLVKLETKTKNTSAAWLHYRSKSKTETGHIEHTRTYPTYPEHIQHTSSSTSDQNTIHIRDLSTVPPQPIRRWTLPARGQDGILRRYTYHARSISFPLLAFRLSHERLIFHFYCRV